MGPSFLDLDDHNNEILMRFFRQYGSIILRPGSLQQKINEIFFSDKMGPSLQGKVCLVTGAARGIGRGELLFNIIEVSGI